MDEIDIFLNKINDELSMSLPMIYKDNSSIGLYEYNGQKEIDPDHIYYEIDEDERLLIIESTISQKDIDFLMSSPLKNLIIIDDYYGFIFYAHIKSIKRMDSTKIKVIIKWDDLKY